MIGGMMADSLEQIEKDIKACQRCELRMTATCPVPGYGSLGADIIILGEAPGREEDEQGLPFVGASGSRLDKLIKLAKLDMNKVFLSNVCRCRPPANRTPKKKEIASCSEFFWREVKVLCPKTVITLGSTPLSLFSQSGVTQMHGTSFEFEVKNDR